MNKIIVNDEFTFILDNRNILRCNKNNEQWGIFLEEPEIYALFTKCLNLQKELDKKQQQSNT